MGYNEVNPGKFALIFLKVASDCLDRFGSILGRFGPFSGHFGSFRTVFLRFGSFSDRFQIDFGSFRIISDRFSDRFRIEKLISPSNF